MSNVIVAHDRSESFEKQLLTLITGEKSVDIWTITPDMAMVMLRWNDRNRPIRAGLSKVYAEKMKQGRFGFTGQSIIFSNERLLDGQHRLEAAIIANNAFEAVVVFGVADEMFSFIDIGKTRTAADVFGILGVPNASLMSATTQLILAYDDRRLTKGARGVGGKDHAELYDQYKNYKAIQKSAWVGHLFATNKISPPSIMAAFHFICCRRNPKEADEFFRHIGEGLGFTDKNDPAYKLHQKLLQNAMSREQKLPRIAICVLVIKAWNALRQGKDVGVLRYRPSEATPEIR